MIGARREIGGNPRLLNQLSLDVEVFLILISPRRDRRDRRARCGKPEASNHQSQEAEINELSQNA